jgi:uncharacterized protein involved in type VI secretion and phage assembly
MKSATGNQTGVVTAVVVSVDDPENQGRIGLKYPWLSDTAQSPMAPVAVALAGNDRGAFFMPEVGDEVLVAFDQGDFAHPYVIGFLWNGQDTPPETTNQNRVIVTPGGHTLRFEDRSGDRRVVLKSSAGHVITLDDAAQTVSVASASGNLTLTMDDGPAQSVTIRGGGRSIVMQGGSVQVL